MGRYNTGPEDLARQIAHLQKRVDSLESGNRAGLTSVDKGSFNIATGTLQVGDVVTFGPIDFGGGPTPGWIFLRADGTAVFTLGGLNSGNQFWALWDKQGDIIFSEDGASGQGLATPWLPIPWDVSSTVVPGINTTSGTFTALMTTRYVKQHPRVQADVLVYCSDGTTAGEIRMAIAGGGPQVGYTLPVTAGYYGVLTIGPAEVPGEHMATAELEIQVRRTAGAGSVGIRVMGSYAVQS